MNGTPTNNPSPKARFQQSSVRISNHRNMVDLEAFQLAADFGMLEYNRLLADQVRDQGTAMATGLKLQGAMEFLQIMRMLSENPKLPPRAQMGDNLDHTV